MGKIRRQCPNCGREMTITGRLFGKAVRCKACDARLHVEADGSVTAEPGSDQAHADPHRDGTSLATVRCEGAATPHTRGDAMSKSNRWPWIVWVLGGLCILTAATGVTALVVALNVGRGSAQPSAVISRGTVGEDASDPLVGEPAASVPAQAQVSERDLVASGRHDRSFAFVVAPDVI